MSVLVLHVGLPKTGTTSVQRALAGPARNHGWFWRSNDNTAEGARPGWDAAGVAPGGTGHGLRPWEGDGSWEQLLDEARSHRRAFVSWENLSAVSPERALHIAARLRDLRFAPLVVVSMVDLHLSLVRWWQQRRREDDTTPDLPTWEQGFGTWRHVRPDPDGQAVRPDVVCALWRRAGVPVQVADCTPPADSVLLFARLLGLPVPDVRHGENVTAPGEYRPEFTAETSRHLSVAQRRIAEAVHAGRVADLTDVPPLEVLP